MAIKQRKQLTGTTEQINAYAGVEGQLVWNKTTKRWVGMSGTAGTNYPMCPERHQHSVANVTDLQTVLNTINDKIPTKTSQLSNDSGFLTTHPTISVAANTLAAGSAATVTKSGTDAAPVFTFGIPKGADGAKGERGETGPRGPQGPAGPSGPIPNAYVIETWHNGYNWYRKWSDGFIEQGGRYSKTAPGGGGGTVSLNISFKDTSYILSLTSLVKSSGIDVKKDSITTSSFSYSHYNLASDDTGLYSTTEITWYACGY